MTSSTQPSGIELLFDNATFNAVSNLDPSPPILQQPKAKMTTNDLINKEQEKGRELQKPSTNWDLLSEFVRKFVMSVYNTFKDIWNKPENVPLFTHISNSINKDDRKLYVGIFVILIAILVYL
jgi:hypothetical protein